MVRRGERSNVPGTDIDRLVRQGAAHSQRQLEAWLIQRLTFCRPYIISPHTTVQVCLIAVTMSVMLYQF